MKVFKNMATSSLLNMDRICNRLRYALLEKEIPYQRTAREMNVGRAVYGKIAYRQGIQDSAALRPEMKLLKTA